MKEIYISKKELEQRERQEYEKNLVAMLSKGSCMRRYRITYKVTRIAGNEFSKEYVVHADNPVEAISKGNARLRYDCLYNFHDEVMGDDRTARIYGSGKILSSSWCCYLDKRTK